MASRSEQVIAGVVALIEGAGTGAEVKRNTDAPDRAPSGGLIIVRDGRAEEEGRTLSPVTYTYTRAIGVEVVAPAPAEERSAVLDAILEKIGLAVEADRSLGGLCDWLEPSPAATDDIQPASTEPTRWADLDILATYTTTNPLT